MGRGYDYNEEAASTIKIEDITADEFNREILHKLKEDNLDSLCVYGCHRHDQHAATHGYCPTSSLDFGWLGYYIGKSTYLNELHFYSNPLQDFTIDDIEPFFRGVNSNRSIFLIIFNDMVLSGDIFQLMRPFWENNHNLSELVAHFCVFGAGSARQLSLALRGCSKSLKSINLSHQNQMEDGELLEDIIEALNVHPQLESLELEDMDVGINDCIALSTLLGSAATKLHTLNLSGSDIDDEKVDILVGALANGRLSILDLSDNCIEVGGCLSLAALLEHPNCNLASLDLSNTSCGCNFIGDEGALAFVNSLAKNNKLKFLGFYSHRESDNGITADVKCQLWQLEKKGIKVNLG